MLSILNLFSDIKRILFLSILIEAHFSTKNYFIDIFNILYLFIIIYIYFEEKASQAISNQYRKR